MIYGITLGLAAGIAPGPLLSLVISETTRGNQLNGILIALAPLITDLPIVLISIFVLSSLSSADQILGLLSIAGGLFIVYMGIQNIRYQAQAVTVKPHYSQSLKYGVIANFLSPHPYLFWITIGAPTFIRASSTNFMDGIAFIISFYILLIGSKIVMAYVTWFFRGNSHGKRIAQIMQIMGVVLVVLGGVMIYDGISQFFFADSQIV